MGMLIRLILCILILVGFLYAYINQQNQIVKLRLQIPKAQRELSLIKEENTQLQFQIDQFENPAHLIELKKKPQYSHLKQPLEDEIIVIEIPKDEDQDPSA